jgi:alpha-galactosidase
MSEGAGRPLATLGELLVAPLAERLASTASCRLAIDGTEHGLALRAGGGGLTGTAGAVEVRAIVQRVEPGSGRLVVRLTNLAPRRVVVEVLEALGLAFWFQPGRDLPRTRHLHGSWHYDACYPPRAFVVEEHLHASADHSKRVGIGGINAGVFSPSMQLAIGADRLHALQIGLEWSGSWEITAGWAVSTFRGETLPSFTLGWRLGLGALALEPGGSQDLPAVHLCSASARSWPALDDRWRAYVRNHVAATPVGPSRFPVSYDHWFGINERFDLALMLAQAERAAALGCEYFCLDAAWYRSDSFEDGLGNWTEPDPRRFPNGFADMRMLAERVRALGMGFGLWQCIQLGRPGTALPSEFPQLYRGPERGSLRAEVISRYGSGDSHRREPTIEGLRLALESERGVELAVSTVADLIGELGLAWMRFETVAEDGLGYVRGLYTVFERLRELAPELYIEACSGGGQSLDLGMVARSNGAWLSDHTTVPSVTRFCQSGALRWYPPEYLNMAVTSRDGGARPGPRPGNLISRMVGTLSFNGDVAAWSADEAAAIRRQVDIFKSLREGRGITTRFPLGQPRSIDDWDAVAYPDAEGGALLYVFRDLGAASISLGESGDDDFTAGGGWEIVLADEGTSLHEERGTLRLELAPWSAALLRRPQR